MNTMWSMEPNEINSLVFCYKSGSFESIKHNRNDTCEEVCKELCKKWNFPPLVQLLFGLRVYGKQIWLADSRPLVKDGKYEFRIRFKTPTLSELKQLNPEAYDYLYHQMRHDVLNNSIPEVGYPNHKNAILGLCVSSMYVDMVENRRDWDYYKRNCKYYIPKKILKENIYFAKNESLKKLREMSNVEFDPLYVKGIYINQIESKAPSYMIEEYTATTDYPPEDNLKGQCRVRFQIAPYHDEQPGLRMLYEYKGTWKHIANFADFYTIQIDRESNIVSLEIQNSPVGVLINMESCEVMESFVSCLCTYYRLTTKWDTDLCSSLGSPSLKFLSELKIHGPIGGTYSYSKLEDRNSDVGTFIIRQCEKIFDTYYIDIVTKENQPETFKIQYEGASGKWTLFQNDNDMGSVFNVLTELAKSIPLEGRSNYFRLQSSPHDKSPLLLLCQTSVKTTMSTTVTSPTGLKGKNPLLLNAANDLLLYKWEQRDYSDRIFTRMKAELIQPNGKKKINVTLKILKQSEVTNKLADFVKLADWWGKLDLSEIVRMHGLTLHQPISLVFESISHGPLDEFLRSHKDRKSINLLNLVETAFSLAKALHYLQENQIVHGRIRCSSLEVTQFLPEREFVVKLADPGIPNTYNVNDVPWIPIEDYKNLNESRRNPKADIWAYSTTLWEIFSRGASPFHDHTNIMNFFLNGNRLAKPLECLVLPAIYNLMLLGWDGDPDKRPLTQIICSILVDAKTKLSRNYAEPHQVNGISVSSHHNGKNGIICNGNSRHNNNNYHSEYNNSIRSVETENTYVPSFPSTITTTAYIENGGGSSNGGSSQVSLLNGHSPNGSGMTLDTYDDFFDEYLSASTGVLEFDNDTKIIFQGEEGRGNHGLVYKGTLETYNEDGLTEIKVAIKRLLHIDSNDISVYKDFVHEAKLMKKLSHENIVKIYGFMETPLIIIMEFMPRTLHRHLNIHRSELKVEHLLQFAEDIAKGMRYLEQREIVHRDLAARNVLVSSDKIINATCKISDFGLAQATNQNGYYVYSRSRKLPIKWYAPECIENYRFSSKSDVWSYAVTLFEMYSFGDSPNLVNDESIMQSGEQILKLLKEGVRLPKPSFCPQHVYEDLMLPCWNENSQQRPSFGAILQRFQNLSREAV